MMLLQDLKGVMKNSQIDIGILNKLQVHFRRRKTPRIRSCTWEIPWYEVVKINCDGSSLGNRGIAGSGSVFRTHTVNENYRRQGHGETLLKAAIQKCRTRKIQRVCLHVDPSRTAAFSLYIRTGFKVDTLIESYYSLDRNAYRMYLEFPDS
ncbi:hypothetical protein GIB67_039144 [Kingdonia uniflora]|uniref:N-acetyltransferase domain-containing protein n=1 Tax=Kingdonia uniflora TaxID=39325 RepID=A0A7J7MLP4_9MAGN|nr:hypothetical protein GIB67_039144 [Kingdonia uniflora]